MPSVINHHHPIIAGLHTALQREYECRLCHIIGVTDTEAKMTAVFVLCYFNGFKAADIAGPYSISKLYVPTVIEKMILRYLKDENYRNLVMRVLNEMEWSDEEGKG